MKTNQWNRKWTAVLLAVALIFSLMPGFAAQAGTVEAPGIPGASGTLVWMKNYGGSAYEVFKDVAAFPGGGSVAVGYTFSSDGDLPGSKGQFDMIIARFDENGNKVWMKNYGGSGSDFFYSVTLAPDGGIVAVGESSSDDGDLPGNQGNEDMVIARFDENGNKVWMKSYGGDSIDTLFRIAPVAGGGYVAAGSSYSAGGDLAGNKGGSDMVVARFGEGGDIVWMKTCGGDGNDYLYSVAQMPGGSYVAVGYSYSAAGDLSGNKGGADMVVAGFDANGNKAWIKNYGGSSYDYFTDVVPAPGGGVTAVGYSLSTDGDVTGSKGRTDMIIARFDASGNQIWLKNYGGEGNDYFYSLAPVAGGGYVAVGDGASEGGDLSGNKGDLDGVVASFQENGDLNWMKNYGGSSADTFNGLAPVSGGDYVVAGNSNSNDGNLPGNKGGMDMAIARVNVSEPDPLLTAIAIVTPPTKTSYAEGETLSLTGLKVKAVYTGGAEQPVTDYTTSPAEGAALRSSDTKVTVSWQGKTASFSITVGKNQAADPKLTVTKTEGGSVLRLPLLGIGIKAGSKITVYAMPQSGYRLAGWEVTGIPAPVAASPLEFTMPAGDVTVKAVFEKQSSCRITASSQGRGLLLGARDTAYVGSTVTMVAIPLWPLSRLDHWEVNGTNAGSGLILSHLVTGDVTIQAIFI